MPMRTTINLAEDALIAARTMARRERLSLGDAVSELIRRGAAAPALGAASAGQGAQTTLRGRFALLPLRDEVITPQNIRDLMKTDGI